MKVVSAARAIEPPGDFVSLFIYPGEFFFCGSNCHINTILGSCIAITLWHPILKVGGMCHFVLPAKGLPTGQSYLDTNFDGRYADGAIALFEREIASHGTSLKEYQAKIFGGSNMLTRSTLKEDEQVGTRNTEAAVRHLTDRGIPIQVAHVGETGHRRIIFDVMTGEVWVKHEPL